jgi:Na+/phosphate symporter
MLKELIKLFKKSNLYKEAHQDACVMLNRANNMFDNASAKLRGREIPHPDIDIFYEERKVDKTERAVRKKVLIHLSATGAMDTPGAIILIGIVIDIERVGDYTTNILELARAANMKLDAGILEDELTNIELEIELLFDVVSKAFEEYDKDAAESVINKKLTRRCEILLHQLMTEDIGLNVQNAVVAALYIRYLKRIAAHLLNIATSLVQPFEKVRFMPESETIKYKQKKEHE